MMVGEPSNSKALPVLAMLIGMVAVSTAGPFILLAPIGPFALPSWRMLSVTAILAPFAASRAREDFSRLNAFDRVKLVLSGVLYGFHFVFFTWAFEHTSKESAVVLLGGQPLMAATIGALWLKEPITRWVAISSVIAIAGIVLFGWNDSITDAGQLLGDGMVVLCCLLIVISYSFGRGLRPKMSLAGYLTAIDGIAGLSALTLAIIKGDALWGYPSQTWVFLICAILIPTLIGHSMFHYAVKYVPVFYINLAILGEPVIALLIMLALKDHFEVFAKSTLTTLQALGGLLLLTGVAFGMIAAQRSQPPKPPTLKSKDEP